MCYVGRERTIPYHTKMCSTYRCNVVIECEGTVRVLYVSELYQIPVNDLQYYLIRLATIDSYWLHFYAVRSVTVF